MKRPAESAGAASGIGLIIAWLAGVDDPDVIVWIGFAVGLIPAAVTLLVANGGVRGVGRLLWRGRSGGPAA